MVCGRSAQSRAEEVRAGGLAGAVLCSFLCNLFFLFPFFCPIGPPYGRPGRWGRRKSWLFAKSGPRKMAVYKRRPPEFGGKWLPRVTNRGPFGARPWRGSRYSTEWAKAASRWNFRATFKDSGGESHCRMADLGRRHFELFCWHLWL